MSEKKEIKNKEEVKTKKKKKMEPMQIFTAIIAGLLCLMMLLSVCGTLIFYLKG